MTSQVRVRFAPSPTGFLHIGGVRTALFNWLYARKHGGSFILRIEDTDLERSEERFTQDIMASMKWLGLTWDEEPLYQSKRLEIYRAKAEALVSAGHAYYCTCTEADVEKMREKAMTEGKRPQYDRTCRGRRERPSGPHVIRAEIPLDGSVVINDLIRGQIEVSNTEVDDFVLVRTNGAPTYNLSVVVDDVETRMTHIVRGDDHINNTPKQLHLYRFFDYPVPAFAHLPMILGPDKKKLSKRHGAVSANLYRAEGYLPEALLNFLARLGWSHGDQEVFTIEEMIRYFDFDHVQKASGVFNEEKLLWLSGEHIRGADPARLAQIVAEDFADCFKAPADSRRVSSPLGAKLVGLIQPKVKLLKDLADQLSPLVVPGAIEVDASGLKWNKDPAIKAAGKAAIEHVIEVLGSKLSSAGVGTSGGANPTDRGEAWGSGPALSDAGLGHDEIDQLLRQIATERGVKLGDLMQPIRLAVTGRLGGADLFGLLSSMPWDVIRPRLEKIGLY